MARNNQIKLKPIKRETKKLQRIKEAKSWFLGKINKIDNYLCKFIKKQREVLINRIRNGG